jgi:hypothetical protein
MILGDKPLISKVVLSHYDQNLIFTSNAPGDITDIHLGQGANSCIGCVFMGIVMEPETLSYL